MSAQTFNDRLDPVQYLPDRDRSLVTNDAHRLAETILDSAHPNVEFQDFSRSALAGAALYVASVAVDGQDRVDQLVAADATGTSDQSIRIRMQGIAELAVDDTDLMGFDQQVRERLQRIAEAGSVRAIVTSR